MALTKPSSNQVVYQPSVRGADQPGARNVPRHDHRILSNDLISILKEQ